MWGMVSNTWGYPNVFLQTVLSIYVQYRQLDLRHYIIYTFLTKKSAMLRHALPHQNCWWLKVICSFLMNILFDDVVGDEADVWFVCFFVLPGDTPSKNTTPKKWSSQSLWFKKIVRLVRWFEAPQGHDAKPVIDRHLGWWRIRVDGGDTPAEDLSCICGKPLWQTTIAMDKSTILMVFTSKDGDVLW